MSRVTNIDQRGFLVNANASSPGNVLASANVLGLLTRQWRPPQFEGASTLVALADVTRGPLLCQSWALSCHFPGHVDVTRRQVSDLEGGRGFIRITARRDAE